MGQWSTCGFLLFFWQRRLATVRGQSHNALDPPTDATSRSAPIKRSISSKLLQMWTETRGPLPLAETMTFLLAKRLTISGALRISTIVIPDRCSRLNGEAMLNRSALSW